MTISGLGENQHGPIRVLHVDDDERFAELTRAFLVREHGRITIDTTNSVTTALARIEERSYDCIISDYNMPEMTGVEFLERVRETHSNLPFVLFTGKGSEEVASDAITAGVSDYLQKETTPEQFALLANRIENLVEQERSRRALAASQERLSLFVEQSPLGIIEWDTDMTILGCNEAAEEILGYDESDLVGEFYQFIVAEESMTAIAELVAELSRATGGFYKVNRNVRGDGTEITCEWHNRVITGDDGEPIAIFSQFRDVTEREEREREIREVRTRYRLLVENFPDGGVFLFDDNLEYTLAGGLELEAVGLTSADFEGATPYDLFPDEIAEELAHYYRRALAGERNTFEQAYQGNHYRIISLPVEGADGEIISGMTVSLNVTENHQNTEALERQLERMDEFAGVVSHDLRNPLGVAAGRLELAMEDCDSEHLAAVLRAHDRMRSLIDDLLTLARTGDPVNTIEAVSIPDLAETSWLNVETGEATLHVETDVTVQADSGRLQQLFENLFRNSVEHGGNTVIVTVGEIRTGADGNGPGVERGLFVADDGPGIPPRAREDVFEAGYSTSTEGTGFGLSIVRQIAETHGWTVQVTEHEGGGARFEVLGIDVVPAVD